MRKYFINILLAVMLSGCATPAYPVPKLMLPSKGIKKLTKVEKEKAEKDLKANLRLLEILTEIEKDIKSKKRKADFFNFALSDDDEITLQAADLLLGYIAEAKKDINKKVILLKERLRK